MKQILIIITILSSSVGFGQNDNTISEQWRKYQYDHIVTLTNIDFYVNDTVIPYTLVQEPDGPFSFEQGHQFSNDSITLEYKFVYHTSTMQKGDTSFPKVVLETKNEVLKINDYLSHFSLKNDSILNTYNSDFQFYPYIKELYYSYIFHQLRLPRLSELDNDSIIRLTNYNVSPIWDENPEINIYELTTAFDQIKRTTYSIDSSHNFLLNKEVIIPLTRRETKLLTATFQSSTQEEIKFSTKTNQYNPFLIEYKNGDEAIIIERSDGADSDERNLNPHDYHSNFQHLVALVNTFGKISARKIERRNRKLNR